MPISINNTGQIPNLQSRESGEFQVRQLEVLRSINVNQNTPWYQTAGKVAKFALPIIIISAIVVLIVAPSIAPIIAPIGIALIALAVIANKCGQCALRGSNSIQPAAPEILDRTEADHNFDDGAGISTIPRIRRNAWGLFSSEIAIDPGLNQESFLQPLQNSFPKTLEENQSDAYKNLIALGNSLLNGKEKDAHTIRNIKEMIGIEDGQNSRGLHLLIYKITRKYSISPLPRENIIEYYEKLTYYLNNIVYYLSNENIDPDVKKAVLERLSEIATHCAIGWMTEAESIYRQFSNEKIYETIEDWVKVNNEQLRRNIVEQLVVEQNHTDYDSEDNENIMDVRNYIRSLNGGIKIPGADDLIDKPLPSNLLISRSRQREFFKIYTSNQLIDHFLTLINGTPVEKTNLSGKKELIRTNVKVDKDKLIDWFTKNLPHDYMPEGAEREYEFLTEIMHEEDDPNGKFVSGDFKKAAIHYLLFTCGILKNSPLKSS